jgi:cytochrome d ubiquinol oxidase subunit II
VLAGADFGAAIWQVTAPRTPDGERLRNFAHHAMAPVWEANHVWLIFVLTVTWTAYPAAFGSLASTLAIALSVAAFGIIVRGAAYAMASGTSNPREVRRIDSVSAISSVLAPFALGACVGALASGRVPYGNARGDLFSSWLNPTSIVTGALAVVFSAYLAAVYLSADAVRHGEHDLVPPFRRRALGAGTAAGVLAVAGLVVLHEDAHRLYHHLVAGAGLPALIVSLLAGAGTMGLVARGRFELARYGAALAVTATVAGWALAQKPQFLPGLTIKQAAAPHAGRGHRRGDRRRDHPVPVTHAAVAPDSRRAAQSPPRSGHSRTSSRPSRPFPVAGRSGARRPCRPRMPDRRNRPPDCG